MNVTTDNRVGQDGNVSEIVKFQKFFDLCWRKETTRLAIGPVGSINDGCCDFG